MILRVMMVLMLGAGVACAQEGGADVPGFGAMPEKALKKLRAQPEVFLQDAAAVIYGFGANGGIDLAGIDGFIAAERARFRAREMARYLAADMDNDGDISRAEMALLADGAAAGKRGRLQRGYDQADADASGVLTVAELRGFAQGVALVQMTDTDAEALRGLLLFDADGNGSAAMEEVAAGVSALVEGGVEG
jgi:Ca2+-binding EF-hand superfamily protein